MKTIFLVWTLMNGEIKDVDAFMDLAYCAEYMKQAHESLDRARSARKEIADQVAGVSLIGCEPVEVEAPQPPPARKESM